MQRAIRGFVEGTGSSDTMTLTPIEGFTNLDLTESPMTASGAEIVIAHSTRASTAFTFFPDGNDHPGDVWFGTNESLRAPAVGTWAYFVAIHEFGHALGLKHPHDGTSLNPVAMPLSHDDHQHTVMSYNSHSSSAPVGLTTNETFGYPQTYMADDIAALQTMYGANYGFRAEDTTYRWSPETGEVFVNGQSRGRPGAGEGDPVENRIFQTIWDGGGTDTYDLSAYTKRRDHQPQSGGVLGVLAREQLAVLAYSFTGGSGLVEADGNVTNARLHDGDSRSLIENAQGGRGPDRITGNEAANVLTGREGDDTLQGGPGNDVLSGGSGTNVAVFAGRRGDYDIAERPGGLLAVTDHQSDRDGADVLSLMKYGQFADGTFRLLPNIAPSGIERSQNSVLDGSRKGKTVAKLSAKDADDSEFPLRARTPFQQPVDDQRQSHRAQESRRLRRPQDPARRRDGHGSGWTLGDESDELLRRARRGGNEGARRARGHARGRPHLRVRRERQARRRIGKRHARRRRGPRRHSCSTRASTRRSTSTGSSISPSRTTRSGSRKGSSKPLARMASSTSMRSGPAPRRTTAATASCTTRGPVRCSTIPTAPATGRRCRSRRSTRACP